jgi:GDSL-like lipase/acylhydrolase family protein
MLIYSHSARLHATRRGGGVKRVTIFAKGNLDVRDSLHVLRNGDMVIWNGINEIMRARHPGHLVRLRHELFTRSDALLEARGEVPAGLMDRALPLDPYTVASQFSTALFQTEADVFVLSIQPDLTMGLFRHKRDGYLLYSNNLQSWPAAENAWFKDDFDGVGLLDVAQSMANLERIVARLRDRSPAYILIYNVSSVVPGEFVHNHEGMDDIFSTRIRRFNLALIEMSQRTGVSVIDVDAVLARAGAAHLKLDAVHLTAEGCRLVAEEVVRVLDDIGCFAPAESGR